MSDYDRAITVFSPDGHLLQVQYASEAANRGLCTAAVKGKNCIVIAGERRLGMKLQDTNTAKKIEVLNDRTVLAFAGLSADGRALVNRARLEAQNYTLSSGSEPGAEYITKYIARLQQKYTIKGGMRPFGVSCLICGYDSHGNACVFKSEPHGIVIGWKAHAIGRNENLINEYFEKHYKPDMCESECVSFILSGISQIMDYNDDNIEVCIIGTAEGAVETGNMIKDLSIRQIKHISSSQLKSYAVYKTDGNDE